MAYKRRLLQILNNKFGHQDYKNVLQKEAVEAIYKGNKDVCIYMPSGFGKSLCYQLPIVAKDKCFAIVISPSVAHAKNQIDYLKSIGVVAYMWNAYSNKLWIKNNIIRNMHSEEPTMKVLYLTAELFITSHFQFLLTNLNPNIIAYLVVDEAHCVSPQSHDYKESYKNLKVMRQKYPNVPIVAVTATASDVVKKDIAVLLHLNSKVIFSMPVIRSNLYYDVYCIGEIVNPIDHLKQFIVKCLGPEDELTPQDTKNCGIIFCQNHNVVENLSNALSSLGVSVLTYSNRFEIKKRYEVQSLWTSGKIKVLVTTTCFGTGISKQPVRLVVHWGTPLSIGHYYQETGRAGHDGLKSFCRIYHNFNELNLSYNSIQNEPDSNSVSKKTYKKIMQQSFCQMKDSFETLECRHVTICKYFDEVVPACKNHCDVCQNKFNVEWKRSNICINNRGKKLYDSMAVEDKECIVLSDDDEHDNITALNCEIINKDSSQSVINEEEEIVSLCNAQTHMSAETQLEILHKLLYKINNESVLNKKEECVVLSDDDEHNESVLNKKDECVVLSDDDEHNNVILSDCEIINKDSSRFIINKEEKIVGLCNDQTHKSAETQLQSLQKLLYKINNESVLNENDDCIVLSHINGCKNNIVTDNHNYQSCDIDIVCRNKTSNTESQTKKRRHKSNRKNEECITISDSDDSDATS